MPNFVHLHTHSEYSMLHGAASIKNLVARAVELGQTALALTDHGNMFGVMEFYATAEKAGIKPIIGCDFFVAPDSRLNCDYDPGRPEYHKLLLLARNQKGYQNLLYLCSEGYLSGYHKKPRIDRECLDKWHGDLICLAGNVKGEIGYYLLRGDDDKALACLDYLQGLFGRNHVYLCVQDHGSPEEARVNRAFVELHRTRGCPLVAVNDVHYLKPEDSEAHDVLTCIDGGWKLDDPDRPRFPSNLYYLRSAEEMEALFKDLPGALENSAAIADSCTLTFNFNTLYWPKFPIPPEFPTDNDYLAHLSRVGLKKHYDVVTPEIEDRLEYELAVMKKMNVAGYMLIVQDFINAAKKMNIPVGPGRGSAVGSLVSYAIGITDVDPLRFNLLFERFLNPERINMPDIDTDFSDQDRDRVIKYVIDKYGVESVAQVVTYGRMKAKMVLRDVGRVLGFSPSEINRLCKLFPPDKPFAKLREAIGFSPELKKELEANNQTERLKTIALKLEGFVRHPGMHAAAIIIAPRPIIEFAPLFKQPGSEQVMIQYDKNYSESIGLLKMDFLGLRNLSVIQDCIKQIKRDTGQKLNALKFPEKDPKTLDIFGKGLTVGVFQFESRGMQDYLRKLKPTGIEDLIAMNALYRPGPIDNIPSYIGRKNGSEKIDYFHENLKPILDETYGVIVYQEQVMQIARELSGFTLGGADILRRVMSKKKPAALAEMKPKFIGGAVQKGYPAKLAEKIWSVLLPFSSYAFNKSHSAAYATIAYQTGYLKAHYPAQFMAASLTSEFNDTDRLVILINDCRQLDIRVSPPCINRSNTDFVSRENTLLYGLSGIKNVGIGACRKLIEERTKNGPFKSIHDLCRRMDISDLNRRAIESLILAGALDALPGHRAQQFASVEGAMSVAAKIQKDKALGQTSLFYSDQGESPMKEDSAPPPDVDAWPYNEMLAKEKEVLGLYLSGHPLEPYRMEMEAFTASSLDKESLSRLKMDSDIILGGVITGLRKKISQKDNRAFAFGVLEDFTGKLEVAFWSDVFEKVQDTVEVDALLLIHGKIRRDTGRGNGFKFVANKVLPLAESRGRLTRSVNVRLDTAGLQKETVDNLHDLCRTWRGGCRFIFHLQTPANGSYTVRSGTVRVDSDSEFTDALAGVAGRENVWLAK